MLSPSLFLCFPIHYFFCSYNQNDKIQHNNDDDDDSTLAHLRNAATITDSTINSRTHTTALLESASNSSDTVWTKFPPLGSASRLCADAELWCWCWF